VESKKRIGNYLEQDEKMDSNEKKQAARLIWQSIKALEDGSVSPEEGRYLALGACELLQKLAGNASKLWAKMAIEAAAVVCRNLAKELKDLEDAK
tara:strand:+ start:141 stop:425 length:285 start_codon:yes stop_codon:yes gene_type:complete